MIRNTLFRNSASTLLGLCALATVVSPVFGQDEPAEQAAKEIAELRKAYQNAVSEVEVLRGRLAVQEKRLAQSNALSEFEARHKEQEYVELEKNYAEVRSQLERFRRSKAEQLAQKDALQGRIAEVQLMLEEVAARQQALKEEKGVRSWQLEASRTLVNRLAEAQIDNRLSLLEAEARVIAVKEMLEKSRGGREFHAQIDMAKQLVENREAVLRLLEKKMAAVQKNSDQRTAVEMEWQNAEMALAQAKSNLMSAVEQAEAGDPELHAMLAQASLDLAVGQKLMKSFAAEEERVSSVIDTAEAMSSFVRQKSALEEELAELNRLQSENHIRVETEARQRMVAIESLTERLLALRVELETLKQKLGDSHPASRKLQNEIKMTEKYLKEMTERTSKN